MTLEEALARIEELERKLASKERNLQLNMEALRHELPKEFFDIPTEEEARKLMADVRQGPHISELIAQVEREVAANGK